MLSKLQSDFLKIIRVCFENDESIEISPDIDFRAIYELACEHCVQSLVYNKIYTVIALPDDLRDVWSDATFFAVSWQMSRQDKFLQVYSKITDSGINAIVLKGIILRAIYPAGDCRPSCDEDIFIEKKDVDRVIGILKGCGMTCRNKYTDALVYEDRKTNLVIELHTELVKDNPPLNVSYKSYLNPDKVAIDGVELRTLNCTEHCLYIFFHIYKHFLFAGIGIRQLCDLYQYINTYYSDIDWSAFYKALEDNNLTRFFYALVNVGQQYLFLDRTLIDVPDIDVDMLVSDVLSSGVYGGSQAERAYINSYIISAANSKSKSRVLNKIKMAFPSYDVMKNRYKYIVNKPYLLPAAWINRFFRIIKSGAFHNSKEAVGLAEKRLDMFEKYGIIVKKD
ncbi:MAG: nucleotidyltransferase family protein [Ruminococcus sp.]|nr:nucleotidyltransferase family protein [Ruminococcus sp.]